MGGRASMGPSMLAHPRADGAFRTLGRMRILVVHGLSGAADGTPT